jgi:uncharacterized damage-inducible protein DinB
METLESFRRRFEYNDWANRRALDALRAMEIPSVRGVRALAHLLIAEKEWLNRLLHNADSSGFDFWQEMPLAECRSLIDENQKAYAKFFENFTENDLASTATYRNSKGVEYTNSHRDILTHVLFHSTYHRGQIALAVREDGSEPAYTDYIAFVREKS